MDQTALRGCLKSPDSVKFGDYTRSFQLPNTWAESYARTVSVEISGLFKHPLRGRSACLPARSRLAFDTQCAVKTDVQTSNEAAVHQLPASTLPSLTASPESGGSRLSTKSNRKWTRRSHPPIGRTLDQGPIAGYFTFVSFADVMFSVGTRKGHCGSDVVRFSRRSANYAIEYGAFSSRS